MRGSKNVGGDSAAASRLCCCCCSVSSKGMVWYPNEESRPAFPSSKHDRSRRLAQRSDEAVGFPPPTLWSERGVTCADSAWVRYNNNYWYFLLYHVRAEINQEESSGMNISLTKEFEHYITQKVESGMYHSASEVIRDGLRLMKACDELHQSKLAELRKEIAIGGSSVRHQSDEF